MRWQGPATLPANSRLVSDSNQAALAGIRVVTMCPNVPGPVAAARLRDLGASGVTIEPPTGDPLEAIAAEWYADLHAGMTVERVDLKSDAGRGTLAAHLAASDVFLTSSRPSALERLGLGWDVLHERYPRLIQIAIVGELPPFAERAGHDLTYVADFGLIDPPAMPPTLLADLAGSERAVTATLAALFARHRDGMGTHTYVALRDAAEAFAMPRKHGLTRPGGRLAGTFPGYRCYATRDGWVAVAALEPHFWKRMRDLLGGSDDRDFAKAFAAADNATWTAWAQEHDMPLAAFV